MDFGETAEPDTSINHDEPTVYIDLFKYATLGSKCVPSTILYCSIGQELSKVYISIFRVLIFMTWAPLH